MTLAFPKHFSNHKHLKIIDMKKIIAIFVMFFNWFVGLFKSTVKEIEPEVEHVPVKKVKKEKYIGKRKHSQHNNRKNSKGRHVQYIEVNGVTKPIYHGAK